MDSETGSGRREVGILRQGRTISFFGGQVPVRVLVAIAVFVAAFLVVWMVLWYVAGGLGLVLGMFVAIVAGFFAVKLYGDRVDDSSA